MKKVCQRSGDRWSICHLMLLGGTLDGWVDVYLKGVDEDELNCWM